MSPTTSSVVPQASPLLTITFFRNRQARRKDTKIVSFEDLAVQVDSMRAQKKDDLPLLKLAEFGDRKSAKGCLRTNDNMGQIWGIEAEHDAGKVTVDAACSLLEREGLAYIIYTTPSHTMDKPRWRLLMPLSKPYPKTDRFKFVSWLNGLFAGQLANESFTMSQPFYYGGISDDYQVYIQDGGPLDARDDFEAGARGPTEILRGPSNGAGKGWSIDELRALLQRVVETGDYWHNSIRDTTASLKAKGWEDEAIADFCAFACFDRDDPALWELIESAGKFAPWHDVPADVAMFIGALQAAQPRPRPQWDYTEKGAIRQSMANATRGLEALGLQFAMDVFHNRLFVDYDEVRAELDDEQLRRLRKAVYSVFRFEFTLANITEAAITLAEENKFNPVLDMLAEAEASWDGKPRLDRMAMDYFNCSDTALNRACVRKTMIAAVKRVREPGCKFDTILTLECAEGWNKSSSFRVLAGDGNFSDESIIGKDSREVQEHLADIWWHENAELAGMAKREVEAVTTFASRQEDRARPAYGRFLRTQPRHSIEVATTNASTYLQKQTGNRRFWPVVVLQPIDLKKLARDRLQLFGEAAHYCSQGEALTLTPALWAIAAEEQEKRRVVEPWEDALTDEAMRPLMHNEGTTEFITNSDIFEHILRRHGLASNGANGRQVRLAMERKGLEYGKCYVGGVQVRGYRREKVANKASTKTD